MLIEEANAIVERAHAQLLAMQIKIVEYDPRWPSMVIDKAPRHSTTLSSVLTVLKGIHYETRRCERYLRLYEGRETSEEITRIAQELGVL